MKLNNIDLIKLLPQFMQDDNNMKALSYAVTKELQLISNNIKIASIYSRIDELQENVLDELAWQFNITEYNISYDIKIKRDLIRNCMLIHHQRGTVGAVERVVNNVFGNARIEEWFEYGGKPYHFKVYTSNPSASDEMLAEFERIINVTQNCRSYLESAIVELFQSMDTTVGITLIQNTKDYLICE